MYQDQDQDQDLCSQDQDQDQDQDLSSRDQDQDQDLSNGSRDQDMSRDLTSLLALQRIIIQCLRVSHLTWDAQTFIFVQCFYLIIITPFSFLNSLHFFIFHIFIRGNT